MRASGFRGHFLASVEIMYVKCGFLACSFYVVDFKWDINPSWLCSLTREVIIGPLAKLNGRSSLSSALSPPAYSAQDLTGTPIQGALGITKGWLVTYSQYVEHSAGAIHSFYIPEPSLNKLTEYKGAPGCSFLFIISVPARGCKQQCVFGGRTGPACCVFYPGRQYSRHWQLQSPHAR